MCTNKGIPGRVSIDTLNRPFSYSRYCTGTSLQPRLMRVVFSNVNDIFLFLMIFPRMSLNCTLVPVQYREYENGQLISLISILINTQFTFRLILGRHTINTDVINGCSIFSWVSDKQIKITSNWFENGLSSTRLKRIVGVQFFKAKRGSASRKKRGS